MIDFNSVVLLYNSPMVEILVNFIFPNGVLDVVLLDLVAPVVVKVVYFAGNLSAVIEVECLVHF